MNISTDPAPSLRYTIADLLHATFMIAIHMFVALWFFYFSQQNPHYFGNMVFAMFACTFLVVCGRYLAQRNIINNKVNSLFGKTLFTLGMEAYVIGFLMGVIFTFSVAIFAFAACIQAPVLFLVGSICFYLCMHLWRIANVTGGANPVPPNPKSKI